MNATSKNIRTGLDTSEEVGKAAPAPSREPLPRRIFVQMRLEEIAARIGDMASEREQLTADLKSQPGEGGPVHKKLRQRRAYIAERLAIIRKEQAGLNAEKKAMGATGERGHGGTQVRSGSGAKNLSLRTERPQERDKH